MKQHESLDVKENILVSDDVEIVIDNIKQKLTGF